ncbi:MAG: transcriptional regulator, partial [Actinobacteria bacterium]|nr:transcriptional regulator [Actinomycetota bacterium]
MKVTRQDPLLKTIEPLIAAIGGLLIDVDQIKNGDVTLEVDGVVVAAVRLPALHG